MLNIGAGELVAILGLALVVLGPNRLPEAVRTAGRVMGEVRRISGGFQQELRNALDEPEPAEPAEDDDDVDPGASRDVTELLD